MFDANEVNELDGLIAERLARPSLVGKMKEKNKAIQSKKLLDFSSDVRKYWYVYLFLSVSSLFTGTLGIYMGIAPILDITSRTIIYQTDVMHLFLALVYFIAFIVVTEGAFVIGKWLFFTREEANLSQKITSFAMMLFSGISILGTGVAGGMVIASQISFMTSFVAIPDSAQKWVVIVIPVLITFYTALVTIYGLSSDSAASERLLNEQKRTADIEHTTRTRSIEQIAVEQLQVTELKRYMQLITEGKISAAEAQAAIRAGRTLGQEEMYQGRDIDGQYGIGNNGTARPRSDGYLAGGGKLTYPPVRPSSVKTYTLDEVLKFAGLSKNEAVSMIQQAGLTDPNMVFNELGTVGYLSDDLTRGNFKHIFQELMAGAIPAKIPSGNNGSHPKP
jgi:hypothetical protein